MSNQATNRDDHAAASDHLADLPDGSGCSEIWEHLSDVRETAAGD